MLKTTDIEARGWERDEHGPSAEGPTFKLGDFRCQILAPNSVNAANAHVWGRANLTIWKHHENGVETIFIGVCDNVRDFSYLCDAVGVPESTIQINDMTVKPITPHEAFNDFEKSFPPFVFEAVNNCINRHCFGKKSFTIKQKAIEEEMIKLAPEGTTVQDLHDKHWLDFEDAYRKAGWVVNYDKPGYNESYEAYFDFKIK